MKPEPQSHITGDGISPKNSRERMGTSSHELSGLERTSAEGPDRLTIFTFFWACQALVHQEFYSAWLPEGNVLGWILTTFALAALVRPQSTVLLLCMLAASVTYNVVKWPFVVNHIFVESIVDLTIIAAIASAYLPALFRRSGAIGDSELRSAGQASLRDVSFDRFAPVLRTMLVVMYAFAFIAKLNVDFFDPDYSCVAAMYDDLVRRFPFIPTERPWQLAAIWGTVVIEAAIPIALTFRRTQPYGVLLGVAFHLILGLIGHRTFSALAYAMYSLFLIEPLFQLTRDVGLTLRARYGEAAVRRLLAAARVAVVIGVGLLILAALTGHYRDGIGPIRIYRIAWMVWILWSLGVGALYAVTIWRYVIRDRSTAPRVRTAGPGLLWLAVLPVVLNGFSQYLGLKTETAFTMYSNLRTEGANNHFFMPSLRLADYQDDLVRVVDTSNEALLPYVDSDHLLTYFEFRRIVSESEGDFFVDYERGGSVFHFTPENHLPQEEILSVPHPLILKKLLYFRPVPEGDRCPCQH